MSAPAKKRGRGRPTSFDPDELPRVTKLCLLGMTNEQLALSLKVDVRTIDRWIASDAEFCRAVKAGREDADGNIVKSLYASGLGGVQLVDEVVTLKTRHPDGTVEERAEVIEVQRYIQPNVTAQIFWLKNRQRERWRDVRNNELSGPGGGPIETRAVDARQLEVGEREALRVFLEARAEAEDVIDEAEAEDPTEETGDDNDAC